jgi:hypothetical protein
MSDNIECPFCHEDDFDLEGLKHHLEYYCEIYAITDKLSNPYFLTGEELKRTEDKVKRGEK